MSKLLHGLVKVRFVKFVLCFSRPLPKPDWRFKCNAWCFLSYFLQLWVVVKVTIEHARLGRPNNHISSSLTMATKPGPTPSICWWPLSVFWTRECKEWRKWFVTSQWWIWPAILLLECNGIFSGNMLWCLLLIFIFSKTDAIWQMFKMCNI